MSWIDILSRLVAIATGLVSLSKTCTDYIKSKKTQKRTHHTPPSQLMGPAMTVLNSHPHQRQQLHHCLFFNFSLTPALDFVKSFTT